MTKTTETNANSPATAAAKPAATQSDKPTEGSKPSAAAAVQPGSATGRPPTSSSSQAATTGHASPFPKSWDEIRVGSVVLAPANEGETYGWWEAVVTAITNDLLTLRWRDYPRDPIKARRRHEVALLFAGQ
jgi:hypothetical protein